MPLKPLDSLPDDSRLWSFGASRPLQDDEEREFLSRLDAFLKQWNAHGHPLDVGRGWRDGRLLVVAVDESTAPPSGCSIDALVRTLKDEGARLDAQFVDNAALFYREPSGTLGRATRGEFSKAVEQGSIDGDTIVFDFTQIRLGDLRQGRWETPASTSWHARAFGIGVSRPG